MTGAEKSAADGVRRVRRVLLVTGARSLGEREGARPWARRRIAEALAPSGAGYVGFDLLLVGDAGGPDDWACTTAGEFTVPVWRFVTRGRTAGLIERDTPTGTEHTCWAPDGDTHPLRRNAAMVRVAAHLADRGDDVYALALLDGLKGRPGDTARRPYGRASGRPTRGTEHTVGLALAAGLRVWREVWRG